MLRTWSFRQPRKLSLFGQRSLAYQKCLNSKSLQTHNKCKASGCICSSWGACGCESDHRQRDWEMKGFRLCDVCNIRRRRESQGRDECKVLGRLASQVQEAFGVG